MELRNLFITCFCSGDETKNTLPVLQETGLDRVKRMYKKTDLGFISPEMYYFVKSATISVSVSAVLGAFIHTHQAKEDYFRQNVATQFESQHLARRRLADSMSLGAIKGGFKYAVKYGSFSSLYLLSTMTVANYNNKITIWEHIGSGALIGGILRINFGLKGMAAAASAGAVLGGVAGGILVLSMWLSNATFQDILASQNHAYYEMKKHQFEKYQGTPQDLLKH